MTNDVSRDTAISATEKRAEKMITMSIFGGLLCAMIGFGLTIIFGHLVYATIDYGPKPITFMFIVVFFIVGQVSVVIAGIGIFKRAFQEK
jgi:hypothetical protein